MENVQLNLSDNQLSKLRNGHNIQIRADQMGSGMNFKLNANNIKKLKNAYKQPKAVRVAMNDEEIEEY
jgi:paraquat-inducible protein B